MDLRPLLSSVPLLLNCGMLDGEALKVCCDEGLEVAPANLLGDDDDLKVKESSPAVILDMDKFAVNRQQL